MYKEDFLQIGGHDELFAPQSREDSDLFNRFLLNGYELIQSWDALVYHFTSRGSRFNKFAGGDTGKDSPEWKRTNSRNERNFIRKWGSNVQHDSTMLPIVSPKYDIGFVVHSCTDELLYLLEPWCSTIFCDFNGNPSESIDDYIETESSNTKINLKEKVYDSNTERALSSDDNHPIGLDINNDIIVIFDGSKLNASNSQFIGKLPLIIQDSGTVGDMKYDIFELKIKRIKDYSKELINAV